MGVPQQSFSPVFKIQGPSSLSGTWPPNVCTEAFLHCLLTARLILDKSGFTFIYSEVACLLACLRSYLLQSLVSQLPCRMLHTGLMNHGSMKNPWDDVSTDFQVSGSCWKEGVVPSFTCLGFRSLKERTTWRMCLTPLGCSQTWFHPDAL